MVHGGRVRAGYRIGEMLFGESPSPPAPLPRAGEGSSAARRGIVHVIGERPGSMHHTFSAYITVLPTSTWSAAGRTDHNHTRVVSGIADTALHPDLAAQASVKIIEETWAKG